MTDNPLARISVAPLANVPIMSRLLCFHLRLQIGSRSKGRSEIFTQTIGILVSKRTNFHNGCLDFAVFLSSLPPFFLNQFFTPIGWLTILPFFLCVRGFNSFSEHLIGAKPAEKKTSYGKELYKWQMMRHPRKLT